MDDVTQQNATLVEESATATRAMHEQAQALAELVALFRVDAGTRPLIPATAAQPALPPVRQAAAASGPAARPVSKPAPRAPTAGSAAKPARKAATVDADWEEF
jgi:methyl-accepting chemotaxis protein